MSHAGNLHVIGLQQVSFRSGHPRGPFGIVSQQQHSFAGLIQAAYRREPWQVILQFRIDGGTPFFVRSRGDQTAGLIQHQINFPRGADKAAIHFNAVAPEIHWGFGIALHGALHLHAAGTNELLRLRTRAIPQLRERSRQPDGSQFSSLPNCS